MNGPDPETEVLTWVGLGSNLQNPVDQVCRALATLAKLPGCRNFHHSSLYRSAPMGPSDQPDYINAVCCFATTISPENLLNELQVIETRHGRVRGNERWGARTLDLDLLFYGDLQQNDEFLTIPHPGIADRAFVLLPILEILAPEVSVPSPEMSVPAHEASPEMSVPAHEVSVPAPVPASEVSVPSEKVSVPGFWLEQVGDLVARVAALGEQRVRRLSKVDQIGWDRQ